MSTFEIEQLRIEVKAMQVRNEKVKAERLERESKANWPEMKRGFTYRASPAIKASDVCSL